MEVNNEFDENNSSHCYEWLVNNCSDTSIFPNQGKVIYKNNGYKTNNSSVSEIYIELYRKIKNNDIQVHDVKPRLSYFISFGGNFEKN